MLPQLFIVPPEHAAPSGGNLYNNGLLGALKALLGPAQAARIQRSTLEALPSLPLASFAVVWLDSLYLERAPALRAQLSSRTRLHLLAHALPSDLARAAGRSRPELPDQERAWLRAFDAALVPSTTMAAGLLRRAPTLGSYLVEPALHACAPQRSLELSLPRVAIIANLVANKGVLPFLQALDAQLSPRDRFALRVLGGFEAEPSYARACRELVAGSPGLSTRVQLLGVQPFDQVLDELSRAHVVLSPSRSESFGLAVADACASGCVVLAQRAGHVAELVSERAGGALVADDAALARALLELCRDPSALRQRLALAAAHALPTRSWQAAARDLLAQLGPLERAWP